MKFNKQQRECFFLLLFQNELNDGEVDNFANLVYENFEERHGVEFSSEDRTVIEDNHEKFLEIAEQIDKKLSYSLKKWALNRIGKVELALLRLYCYEMVEGELDKKLINHILNLANKYGKEDSSKFINGVIKNINDNETL